MTSIGVEVSRVDAVGVTFYIPKTTNLKATKVPRECSHELDLPPQANIPTYFPDPSSNMSHISKPKVP